VTPPPSPLYESCSELSDCLERVDARLAPWRLPATARVLVGAEPETRDPALRLATDFQARHPGVEVTLHVAGRAALLARCTKGVDDVYVLALAVDALPAAQRWSVTHATGREMSCCAALFLREALLLQSAEVEPAGAAATGEAGEVETADLVAATSGPSGARAPRHGRRLSQRSVRRGLR